MRIEETELIPVFVDVETYVDTEVTLKKQTLRKYLAATYLTALAVAVGREEPEVIDFNEGEPSEYGKQVIEELKKLALDKRFVFVAHNAAFDIRVLRFLLGLPQPCNVWCTVEGAMGAWPDLPGGFGLANCGTKLKLKKRKFDLTLNDLGRLRSQAVKKANGVPWNHIADELQEQMKVIIASAGIPIPVYANEEFIDEVLKIYNKRDVEVMQDLYYREVEILPDVEKRIALMTHRVRRNHFKISNDRLEGLIEQLRETAEVAESTASRLLHEELDEDTAQNALKDIFNDTSGNTESIRYLRLRKVINTSLGAPELKSTSLKKLNPVMLAPHQNVANLLEQTSRVSKMIFHRRRAQVFRNMDEVDVELGYMRAITGRFSSPSSGAGGLNLHNCPKHDKAVAKPVRQLFRVPDHLCLVRGDLANVEYRCIMEGTLVGTIKGPKRIEDITNMDYVWDGEEFVKCGGAVCNGLKGAITIRGVNMTPDHQVLTKHGWVEAKDVNEDDLILDKVGVPLLEYKTSTFGYVYDILDCGPRNRFVVGDLIVHNCEGRLTECRTITEMFEKNVLADPYCEAWKAMTGQAINKSMPIRQVSKMAVLGLGFLMSATGYAKVLLRAISSGDVTIEMLRTIAKDLAWMDPGKPVDSIINNVGCERAVALAAYHIHRSFNSAHPEFNMIGEWLLRCATVVANTHKDPDNCFEKAKVLIEQMRNSSSAPNPDLIYVDIDPDRTFEFPSLRIKCGPWVPTLCWREPKMERSIFEQQLSEYRLCIRKATGAWKPFTKQLAIENVTQAAARNALCDGLIKLEKMGYEDILHVHDEIMLMVPKERNAVLKARDDLLKVFGPAATGKPMGWAVLIKPEEVSITQSLYEDEDDLAVTIKNKKTGEVRPGGDRWGKIERNELLCLENLP
jgi:hypothetical protein